MVAHGEGGCSIRDTHGSSKHCEHSLGKLAFVLSRVCSSAFEGAKTIRLGCFSKRKLNSEPFFERCNFAVLFFSLRASPSHWALAALAPARLL